MVLEMDQLYEFDRVYVNRDLRFVKILKERQNLHSMANARWENRTQANTYDRGWRA